MIDNKFKWEMKVVQKSSKENGAFTCISHMGRSHLVKYTYIQNMNRNLVIEDLLEKNGY